MTKFMNISQELDKRKKKSYIIDSLKQIEYSREDNVSYLLLEAISSKRKLLLKK